MDNPEKLMEISCQKIQARKKCFSVKGCTFGTKIKGKTLTLNRHDKTKVRKYIKVKAGHLCIVENYYIITKGYIGLIRY